MSSSRSYFTKIRNFFRRRISSARKFFPFFTANKSSPIQDISELQDSGRASDERGPSRLQEGRGNEENVLSRVHEERGHAEGVLGVSQLQADREAVLEASQVQEESDCSEVVFGSRGQEEGEDAETIRTSELQEDRNASIHPDKQLEAPVRKSRGSNFGAKTQLNMVKFTIQTLQRLADSAPVPGVSAAFATLLDVINNVQQSRDNEEGLEKLKERFKRLSPIFSHIAEHQEEETKLRPIIEGIALEVKSLTDDLHAASKQGKISQFFNSTDNASALSKHILVLDQIVADSTLTGVVALHSQIKKMNRNSVVNVANVTAGDGSEGGSSSVTGGTGGAGGAFKVSTRHGVSYNFSGLQGGSGGQGGWGHTAGGAGGAGGGFDFS